MPLQKELTELQSYFRNTRGAVNVLFEAHYWGTFRLLTDTANLVTDSQRFIPFGQSQSPPYNTWLLIDMEQEAIVLREGEEVTTKIIASSIEEFLGDWGFFKECLQQEKSSYIFDQRIPMMELLSPDQYIVTEINDPEFFEDLAGYYELLRIVRILTKGDLHFTKVTGQEKGTKKTLQLYREDRQWEISLTKELFDNEIIHRLNDILMEEGMADYSLSTSVNEEMKMVVMRLSEEEFDQLGRMGLLI